MAIDCFCMNLLIGLLLLFGPAVSVASSIQFQKLQELYKKAKSFRKTYRAALADGFDWQLPKEGLAKAAGCPKFDNYYFVQGRTYQKYDMYKPCGAQLTPAKLADLCSQAPYCQGFTTAGMLKFRIPPGDLGTGDPACSLCKKRRQLMQQEVADGLDREDYYQWAAVPAQQMQANKCAGTYVSKNGGFEQFLRSGLELSDADGQVIAKSKQNMDKKTELQYFITAKRKKQAASIPMLRLAPLKGEKRTVAAPAVTLDKHIEKKYLAQMTQQQGGAQAVEKQEVTAEDVMLTLALPAAYDSSQPSSTGGYNFIPPPRDQGKCATCAVFAATTLAPVAMAAAKRQDAQQMPGFSPQYLYFCADNPAKTRLCSDGITMEAALQGISSGSIVTEDCLRYSASFSVSNKRPKDVCKQSCSNKPEGRFEWGVLDSVAKAKEAIVRNGAVASVMALYPDMVNAGLCRPNQAYALSQSIPDQLVVEFHAVLVVGWDDNEGYWLIQNSWGNWPGGSKPGVFKVKKGEAGLMMYPGLIYWMRWTGPGAKPQTLNPDYVKPDSSSKGRCSWYTAQPGDTLAGVWRKVAASNQGGAAGVSLQQLLAANDDESLLQGGTITGKRVRFCAK